jgi:hypothetical protein
MCPLNVSYQNTWSWKSTGQITNTDLKIESSLLYPALLKHNFQTPAKPFGQTQVNGLSNIRPYSDLSNSIQAIPNPQLSYPRSRISNLKMQRIRPVTTCSRQRRGFQAGLTSIDMAVKVGWANYQGQASHRLATSTNSHRLIGMVMMIRPTTREGV